MQKEKTARALAGLLAAGILFGLTGCGNAIPEMTEEETVSVGEYAAFVMLKYDAKHRSRLVDLELYPEQEEPVQTVPAETEPPAGDPEEEQTPETSVPVIDSHTEEAAFSSVEELLGLPGGVSLSFAYYSVQSSYPEDLGDEIYFALDATEGKRFLVLHYLLANGSGAQQALNFLYADASFKVEVNGVEKKTALVTMLSDDLSTYLGTLEDGASEEVVLLFEIDEGIAASVDGIVLTVKSSQGSVSETLL